MKCSDCQDLLSDYIDDELHELKHTQVRMHLEKCPECNTIHEDLTQIVSVSRVLPTLAPRNELWEKIEDEIRELTAKPATQRKAGNWGRFWGYRLNLSLSMPQLAGSAIGLIALLVLTASVSYRPEQVTAGSQDAVLTSTHSTIVARPLSSVMNPEEAELNGAISRYMQSLEKRRAKWDPKMQELFDRNLEIVDRSVAECRQMVLRNPNDQVAREVLIIAYKEKLRLLEQFSPF
jgi:hypothetical protein